MKVAITELIQETNKTLDQEIIDVSGACFSVERRTSERRQSSKKPKTFKRTGNIRRLKTIKLKSNIS